MAGSNGSGGDSAAPGAFVGSALLASWAGRAALLVVLAGSVLASCTQAPCPAWDAHGDGGLCNLILGAAWNGERCVYLFGCSCVGRDCDLVRGEDDSLCTMSACNPRPVDGGASSRSTSGP